MTRVLVVEDSPTQAEELRLILESEGFVVEKSGDGEAALERLARAPAFDLVVSDIVMPKMSGYELCRRIKVIPALRQVPVILVTTLSDPMDIIQGLECGADNFIPKPFDPAHLVERMQSLLASRRARAENAVKVGVEIVFLGRKFTVTSDKNQILDLLISTFEDVVRTNRDLHASQSEVARAKMQLEEYAKRLEDANRELEAFSYSVAHDLRAPLRSIAGFSRALVEDAGDQLGEDGQDHLRRIRDATNRMSDLIEDLLKLSRASRAEMRRTEVDLSRIAREVVGRIAAAAPSETACVIQEGVFADADPSLVAIVLENLLSNAFKFSSRAAAPRVEFGCVHQGTEGTYFVRDNGAGFDAEYADKLFVVFQRLHSASEFEGTGIGLSIVKRIVTRHGGRVWASGAVGRGATFYFTLS